MTRTGTIKWSEFCERNGMQQLKRIHNQHGEILIAGGYIHYDPDYIDEETGANMGPHFKMAWGVRRNTQVRAMIDYHNRFSSQQERINACIYRAKEFIANNIEAGNYA